MYEIIKKVNLGLILKKQINIKIIRFISLVFKKKMMFYYLRSKTTKTLKNNFIAKIIIVIMMNCSIILLNLISYFV